MKIFAADWLPYALPLKQPWQTHRGTFSQRTGRLLRLQTADNRTGWGDCAPLPEFGISAAAAAAFAEETAQLDLVAQRAGQPLHGWLSGEAPVADVAVNQNFGSILNFAGGPGEAKIGPNGSAGESMAHRLKRSAEAGFSVIKFKVGVSPIDLEIAAMLEIADALPAGLRLRLDANCAWSRDEAQRFLSACGGLPIESLEEPLAEPDFDFLQKIQSTVAFPLAIDESVHLLDTRFFRHPPVRRIVLKPARHGGLLASTELALRARASDIEVIVTSSLESACGLLACAHLAAAVAPTAIHGLATAEWFASDTGEPPPIANGRLKLPDAAGLGFHPFGA